jgi:predicted alpha/beta superfamily hydrolase
MVKTTVRVHYPNAAAITVQNGTNATLGAIQLRGSSAPLSWTQSMQGATNGDVAVFEVQAPQGQVIEFKPVIESSVGATGSPGLTWSVGANYKILGGSTRDVYPHFFNYQGKVVTLFSQFISHVLTPNRDVLAYLPPSYDENKAATYPVLYMHDGQNLFDPSTAFGGTEWKVDETLDAGVMDGSIPEVIVIGIDNTADRIPEYTPNKDSQYGGGNGDAYLSFIINELMPEVKKALRIKEGPEFTGMMGSSLGGLISAYTGVHHADVFGRIGAMSPSTWWNNDFIIGDVAKTGATRPLKVYVDSGDAGPSNDDVTLTATLAQTYAALGYKEGDTMHYVVGHNGQHNEYYWSLRLPGALQFLFSDL